MDPSFNGKSFMASMYLMYMFLEQIIAWSTKFLSLLAPVLF